MDLKKALVTSRERLGFPSWTPYAYRREDSDDGRTTVVRASAEGEGDVYRFFGGVLESVSAARERDFDPKFEWSPNGAGRCVGTCQDFYEVGLWGGGCCLTCHDDDGMLEKPRRFDDGAPSDVLDYASFCCRLHSVAEGMTPLDWLKVQLNYEARESGVSGIVWRFDFANPPMNRCVRCEATLRHLRRVESGLTLKDVLRIVEESAAAARIRRMWSRGDWLVMLPLNPNLSGCFADDLDGIPCGDPPEPHVGVRCVTEISLEPFMRNHRKEAGE